jgi:histidyl-tRNA synthetase
MPSSSAVHRALGKKKGHLSHQEIMNKRHEKKKKKEKKNSFLRKKELLEEYQKLNKVDYSDKKDTSMKIMDLIEEIKENKCEMTDKHYLDIMDLLMSLNKGTMYTDPPVRRNLDNYYDEIIDNPIDRELPFFYDRTPQNNNIYGIGTRTGLSIIYTRFNDYVQGAEDAF